MLRDLPRFQGRGGKDTTNRPSSKSIRSHDDVQPFSSYILGLAIELHS